jgi:RNA polymerase sigma-70 factor (ECF subfamily)
MVDFQEVYNLYFRDVYKYALSLSRDPTVAEEITQETFFKAMKSIGSFRGQCRLYVWLCQIAKNTYISYSQKQSRIFPEMECTDESTLE